MALADDYAGLDELAGKGKGKQPKARRLRTLEEREGASIVEQLREIMAVHFQRVATVLRQWDEDGNGTVDRREFCRALPVLGLAVPAEAAGALFDSLDTDGSGALDYEEMHKELRAGVGVELDEVLRVGGAGEIAVEARNAAALRGGKLDKDSSKIFGKAAMLDASSGVPILQQLQRALASPGVLARVIDIFRAWDEDGSGTVSRFEFARALPVLGLRVERAQAESLFDSIDEDGSGSVEYAELHRKLRRHGASGAASTSSLPTIQQRRGHSVAASPSVASAPAIGYSAVRRAVAEELEARRELTRLQRQLRLADRQSALQAAQQKRRAENVAFKAAMDARVGRDLNAVIADISPATDAQMVDMANAIYGALAGASWYVLFKEIDEDSSGRISYAELRKAIRQRLGLSASAMPESELRAVWRALDEDASGYISAGEFGRFMRKGTVASGGNRTRLGAEKDPAAATRRAEKATAKITAAKAAAKASEPAGPPSVLQRMNELRMADARECARVLAEGGVERAGEDDMCEVATLLMTELARVAPEAREWYHLFKKIDEDASGVVTFSEFERAVRQMLRLPRTTLPDGRLQGVWMALDENLDGGIDAGEFGRFMRRAERAGALKSSTTVADPPPRGWRPAYKSIHDDIDPADEHDIALTAEARRAEAAAEELRREAKRLQARLPALSPTVQLGARRCRRCAV